MLHALAKAQLVLPTGTKPKKYTSSISTKVESRPHRLLDAQNWTKTADLVIRM
jgi:hypothetical protein